MSTHDIEVTRADLLQAADVLDGVAEALRTQAPDLRRTPDAGASSDEVATALAVLGEAVAGLGEHIGSVAASTRSTADDFTGTDQAVHGAMTQRRGGLQP